MKYYIEYSHLYDSSNDISKALCTREQLVKLLENQLYSLWVARLVNPELESFDDIDELEIEVS